PIYAAKFRELIHLRSNGQFSINSDFISYHTHGLNRPFKRIFSDTFGPPRLPDEPIADRHRDLAYALQSAVEDTILHIVLALSRSNPSRNLCLSGGVALNCVANPRLLSHSTYRSIW